MVHRAPPQSPEVFGGLSMLYQSALGQVSMQAGRVRPYQPQVPGLGDSRETVTQVSPMLTRAPNKARGM